MTSEGRTRAERAFRALPEAQQLALLREIFDVLEFDCDGNPGAEWSSDELQYIAEAFGRYGVAFTSPHEVHGPYCTGCAHDCEWNRLTGCRVCDDHADAIHEGYGDTPCACVNCAPSEVAE